MQRNKNLFYIVRATFLPFFWLPVLYIYLTQYKELDVATTMFFLGLQELSLIFLEIPTGVIADKISRRFSIALGYILTALPFVFLPFFNSYWILALIFITKATGKALVSGADKSLLYDLILDNKKEDQYKIFLNKANSLMLGVSAFCILIGGFIAEYSNIEYTLYLPLPFMIIGAIATMLMDEPETSKKGKILQEVNYIKHTWQALKYIFSKKYLISGLFMFSLARGLAVNMKWFYTPIFDYFDINLAQIGGFTFGLYLLKSLSAYVGSKLFHKNNEINIKIINIILMIAFIIGGIFLNKFLLFSLLLTILFASEMLLSSTEEYLHKELSSKDRATAMSIISLFSSIMATIMINGWGLAQSKYGLGFALIFIGILFALGIIIFMTLSKRKKTFAD